MSKYLKTYSEVLKWLEDWAITYKEISHTKAQPKFWNNVDEYLNAKNVKGRHLVVAPRTGSYAKPVDYRQKNYSFRLWFLHPCKKDDRMDQQRIYDETQINADDLVARLEWERDDAPVRNRLFAGFNINNVQFDPIGPQSENCYGTGLTINMGVPFDTFYRPDDPATKAKYLNL